MEELNLDFWRQRGYLIPNTYTIDEDQTYIDYTIQYLFAVPVKKVFQNKLTYLKNQSNVRKNLYFSFIQNGVIIALKLNLQ